MKLEEFNNLNETDKNTAIEEMLKLYSLITNYPSNIEDLKAFVEWQLPMGKFGEDMKNLLVGVYPTDTTNYTNEQLLDLSNKALDFVTYWNKIAQIRVVGY